MNKLEIACFNVESAQIAHENGADRIELCDGFEVGGTTPNPMDVINTRKFLFSDLFVMIRPRGGNFVYYNEEFAQMKLNILHFKSLKVNGFVFGILDENNKIDIERNTELVNLAKPFPCTFHRAFDEVVDYKQALEDVISCGFSIILTSGTHSNVMDGIDVLKNLVHLAQNRITIMPGGGLRSTNINLIQEVTQATFYHSSAITDESQMANPEEIFNLKSNLK
ncbi:copper homeostasis protein CutC [Flavobacterium sp.]|uniref:copper homeostasis protein CutC n=1 Tax=Flavobacterium sp. TaxID=239 RepID=UPI002639EA6A|nr:copper homeostasis protein CutC [Flavobacterium sp.]